MTLQLSRLARIIKKLMLGYDGTSARLTGVGENWWIWTNVTWVSWGFSSRSPFMLANHSRKPAVNRKTEVENSFYFTFKTPLLLCIIVAQILLEISLTMMLSILWKKQKRGLL